MQLIIMAVIRHHFTLPENKYTVRGASNNIPNAIQDFKHHPPKIEHIAICAINVLIISLVSLAFIIASVIVFFIIVVIIFLKNVGLQEAILGNRIRGGAKLPSHANFLPSPRVPQSGIPTLREKILCQAKLNRITILSPKGFFIPCSSVPLPPKNSYEVTSYGYILRAVKSFIHSEGRLPTIFPFILM